MRACDRAESLLIVIVVTVGSSMKLETRDLGSGYLGLCCISVDRTFLNAIVNTNKTPLI